MILCRFGCETFEASLEFSPWGVATPAVSPLLGQRGRKHLRNAVLRTRNLSAVAPWLLDPALPSQEVGALYCASFVGGFKDETVAEVQCDDARLFASKPHRAWV